MRVIGIRELKNRLSEYVRMVRNGKEILVTDRGEVVAELKAPDPRKSVVGPYAGLASLERRGAASLGANNEREVYPLLKPALKRGSSAELLEFERGSH